jgi:hypothetical protein
VFYHLLSVDNTGQNGIENPDSEAESVSLFRAEKDLVNLDAWVHRDQSAYQISNVVNEWRHSDLSALVLHDHRRRFGVGHQAHSDDPSHLDTPWAEQSSELTHSSIAQTDFLNVSAKPVPHNENETGEEGKRDTQRPMNNACVHRCPEHDESRADAH